MAKNETVDTLKKLSKDRMITAAQLAKDIGCSKSYLNMLFSGSTRYGPSEELENNMKKWINSCWVCGSKWKAK
jgi:hypothetical protein